MVEINLPIRLFGNTPDKDLDERDIQILDIGRMRKNRKRFKNIFKRRRGRGIAAASSRFGEPGGGDPFFSNVLFLMDWEDSATLLSNPNLGSWVGTPSYSTMLIETGSPLMGDQSVITNGSTSAVIFTTWDPATGPWTVEWSSMYNGSVFPSSAGTSTSDLLSMYNATFSNRGFLVLLVGNGDSTHSIRVVLSTDGITNDTNLTFNLGFDVSANNTTVYHWAVERDGDNISVYYATSGFNLENLSTNYTLVGTQSLSASYDIFTTDEQFRIGTRESGGTNTPSGRTDNLRLTETVARFEGGSSPALDLPHQRVA